ncbi:MAG: T9SS type A sorting domain-containing protein [Candidatus Marinimicrobia bacterium]|nr:T9SS type A sorting domain-containing protein [Candidatus Neomarinimicrobiota bacterium]
MKNTYSNWLLLGVLATQGYTQMNFVPHSLVSIPGVNINYEISEDYFDNGSQFYMCWENRNDSTGFSIYRMIVWPILESPELIASSNDSLLNPDINVHGDLVWQARENGNWILKYYSEADGSTESITNANQNSTQPSLGNSILVYVQDTNLVYLNLNNQESAVVDVGNISNPDLNPEAYGSFWVVAYEKQIQDTTSIFVASRSISNPPYSINRYSSGMINKYPRFGTMGGLAYQSFEDTTWSVVLDDWTSIQIQNATKPALLTVPVPVARVVEDWLVFYECDSIEGNSEIYAYGLSGIELIANISNLPGNDFNPECSILSYDTVAVFWEHEVEGGREIWWAKDSLHIRGGAVDHEAIRPANFGIINAYPNPFNSNVNAKYSVSTRTEINISIFDINGNLVIETIVNKNVGTYNHHWDGTNSHGLEMSSGVYVVQFTDAYNLFSRKIVLLK